jgi:hypothetical protein
MSQYKANLLTINNRYGDFEKRVLLYFADRPGVDEIRLTLSGNNDILIMNLMKDGLLEFIRELVSGFSVGIDPDKIYRLTPKGRDFIQSWVSAHKLEYICARNFSCLESMDCWCNYTTCLLEIPEQKENVDCMCPDCLSVTTKAIDMNNAVTVMK